MIKTYRKLPVEIEAVYYDGNNYDEVKEFIGLGASKAKANMVAIQTLEGLMFATPGDMIIKGVQGEFYPCKPDIFNETYEEII